MTKSNSVESFVQCRCLNYTYVAAISDTESHGIQYPRLKRRIRAKQQMWEELMEHFLLALKTITLFSNGFSFPKKDSPHAAPARHNIQGKIYFSLHFHWEYCCFYNFQHRILVLKKQTNKQNKINSPYFLITFRLDNLTHTARKAAQSRFIFIRNTHFYMLHHPSTTLPLSQWVHHLSA